MAVLVTGGLGYIGSNTVVELLNENYEVIIVDNLSNSSLNVLNKIKRITNKNPICYNIDIVESDIIFRKYEINTVIHFAAYKAVQESVTDPLKYYENNVSKLISLLQMVVKYSVKNFIFSSSATVYGNPTSLPLTEKSLTLPINPYGQTKLMGEVILKDLSKSNGLNITILRYFNPVGSVYGLHDDPKEPNNLFPYIMKVVNGEKEYLSIFGNDYETPDGTAIRDYLHVYDLALAHIKAINNNLTELHSDSDNKIKIYNLGTGKGYSVLEIVDTFNEILIEQNRQKINYNFCERRQGDAAEVYADSSLAESELDWVTTKTLRDMILDTLN